MLINSRDTPELWDAFVRRFFRRLDERIANLPPLPPLPQSSPLEEPQHQQAPEPSQSHPHLRLVE